MSVCGLSELFCDLQVATGGSREQGVDFSEVLFASGSFDVKSFKFIVFHQTKLSF